jgi:hypothetical protein
MVETRFRWFGHVKSVDFVVKRVDVVRSLEAEEDLKQKTIRETIKKGLEINGFNQNMVYDITL